MTIFWQIEYYFGKRFRPEMLLRPAQTKAARTELKQQKVASIPQNVSSDLPARPRQARPLMNTGERDMKNPEYFRLSKDGHFIGFKRVVTEFLPIGGDKWQLRHFEHDEDQTQKLSKPALGIEALKRPRIRSN